MSLASRSHVWSTPLGIMLGLLVLGALVAAWGFASRSDDAPGVRRILVTGFGPFGAYATNPAWESIRNLDGRRVGNLEVHTAQIDVVYATVGPQIEALLDRVRPDLVLSLGVAPGEHLRIEKVAKNRDTSPHPDNAGEVRLDLPIREGGPDLPTRLPVHELLATLHIEGYEVRPSEDAGGYLCNHLFYELMARVPAGRPAGFVHVPELTGPWSRERLERAVLRILEVLDASTRDAARP